MPTINGMKMACEPCIRGHRSTKCTHANERLMVPVRKPGRPLSACPHPKDQACGCGGVTAAIPRKQACGCGTNEPPVLSRPAPQDTSTTLADLPSPTKSAFKVQKGSGRPQSSMKQSFDPANFERMDMNSVNIVQFEQRTQSIQVPFPNGYATTGPPQPYGYIPQYSSMQTKYTQIPVQEPVHSLSTMLDSTNGFITTPLPENGFEHNTTELRMADTSGETPMSTMSGNIMNGGSCCAPPVPAFNGESNGMAIGGSTTRPPNHSHSSSSASSLSEPPEIQAGSCCSSKPRTDVPKLESFSSQGSPVDMTPQTQHHVLPQSETPFNPILYPQYLPQATVFTYPATYGSFENPLQPSAWLESVRANSYNTAQPPNSVPPPVSFSTPIIPGSLETVHTCGCGDGCQCIGCAAHPYNDATKEYVRNAWSEQGRRPEVYSNGTNGTSKSNGNGNGNVGIQSQNIDTVSSPAAQTPSSTTSGNGEADQVMSAADFFFVNYNFDGEGCGGDTQSCPCGDDCECIGCTIHKPGALQMPCVGEKDFCPCGDECECAGCEIHRNGHNGNATA